MKIKKNRVKGVCDVSRCKNLQETVHPMDDGSLTLLCRKHSIEAEFREKSKVKPVLAASLEAASAVRLASPQDKLEGVRQQLQKFKESDFVKELQNETREQQEALEMVRAFEVSSEQDFALLESILKDCKAKAKEYETKRTEFTKPAYAILREFNSWFKPVKDVLSQIKTEVEIKLRDYLAACQVQQQQLIAEKALVEAAQVAPETTAAYIDNWKFEVVDISVLPPEYTKTVPDYEKIESKVEELKDETQIPGVRVWNQQIIRS